MKLILSTLILFGLISCISIDRVLLLQKEGFVFSDLKDESELVSYFLTTKQKDHFKKLDADSKWLFLSDFWETHKYNIATCPFFVSTDYNQFQQEIVARVKYANRHFSHFKDGWETDMGKIYIIHGEPFEVLVLSTDHISTLKPKDYQIWKYVNSKYQTYLFIDLQQHGDFRLFFRDGDEQGGSQEYWENLLDATFDEESLYYWR